MPISQGVMGLHRPKEAAAAYEAAIATDPNNASLHFALGKAFTEVADWKKGAESFREVNGNQTRQRERFFFPRRCIDRDGIYGGGEKALRAAVALDSGVSGHALSSLLFVSNYRAGLPVSTIMADAQRLGRRWRDR